MRLPSRVILVLTTFTNILGQFFTGREVFTERHDFIFKGIYRATTMKQDVVF